MYKRQGLSRAIYKATEIVSNGIDNVPTIRPVLDLSAVRAGANEIGGILGMDHALSLIHILLSLSYRKR